MPRTRETAHQRRTRGAEHKRRVRQAYLHSTVSKHSKNNQHRRKQRAKQIQHEAAEQGTPCPQPDKHAYITKAEAQDALWHSWRIPDGRHKPVRIYQCACDCWHLTAQPYKPPK